MLCRRSLIHDLEYVALKLKSLIITESSPEGFYHEVLSDSSIWRRGPSEYSLEVTSGKVWCLSISINHL